MAHPIHERQIDAMIKDAKAMILATPLSDDDKRNIVEAQERWAAGQKRLIRQGRNWEQIEAQRAYNNDW